MKHHHLFRRAFNISVFCAAMPACGSDPVSDGSTPASGGASAGATFGGGGAGTTANGGSTPSDTSLAGSLAGSVGGSTSTAAAGSDSLAGGGTASVGGGGSGGVTSAIGGTGGTGGSSGGGQAGNGTAGAAGASASRMGPPMGFNTYNHFGGSPSDNLLRKVADAMASNGMKAAGYEYVSVDEGWVGSRDAQGNPQSNQNFPNGMKAVADYIHGKGLKFGIYTAPGTKTCAGRIGSGGHVTQDVKVYAGWGVDLIKLDWCGADYSASGAEEIARQWQQAIAATGRPIVLSINAGADTSVAPWASKHVTMWRTGDDICASWYNKTKAHNPATKDCFNTMYHNGIYDYLMNNQVSKYSQYVGYGHWGDPDMLEVGNAGLSFEEAKTHFSLWAMWAAPLIAGNDPTQMNGSDDASKILLNTEVIAIDQDPKNVIGSKIKDNNGLQIWKKPLNAANTVAAALINASDGAASITLNWSDLGLSGARAARDVWAKQDVSVSGTSYTTTVPAHGTVLLRVTGN